MGRLSLPRASRRRRVELRSRHGRPLGRYFPELTAALSRLPPERWLIDGELLVIVGGQFDFAALMARLHPAPSRVRELASRTPAIFVAFDLPAVGREDLRGAAFAERRRRLLRLFARTGPPLYVTPATEDRARAARWLERFRGGGVDGVVAKHRELRYESRARAMLKVKRERTADCVVAGLRASGEPPAVALLMLGLYAIAAPLEHVGWKDGARSGPASVRRPPR